MYTLSSRGLGKAGRVAALVAVACFAPVFGPLLPSPVRGQEPVLELRDFPLDLALRYLEHAGVRFRVDGDFPDLSARIVVGQEMVVEPRAIARIQVLQLFTAPRPRPEPEVVEVPVEVPVEVVREVPVEVPVEVIREVPVEVVREVPVEVPVEGSGGVTWPQAAGLAVAAVFLSLIGCRTLGRVGGRRPESPDEGVREEEDRGEARPEKGALPEFRAVIVDEAISSAGGRPAGEVDS